jgi:hypothetical protein
MNASVDEAYTKVKSVIDSCETPHQLEAAKRWGQSVARRYRMPNYCMERILFLAGCKNKSLT